MGIFDILKTAAKVAQEAGKIELYQQILEAQQVLLDQQKQIADLEESNKSLRTRLEIKGKLISEDNVYWIETTDKKDGPFCTCCWDSEEKLVRLHRRRNSGRVECPKCKNAAVPGQSHVTYPGKY